MAELSCWGARGSARRRRFALLSVTPLVFGVFLEASKSYRGDSRTVAKLSSIRTQRSLFHRIQRSFDPPKHLETSKGIVETDCRGPSRGSPAPEGARPWDGRAPASARLGHGRPTWPSSPAGGLGGRPRAVDSPFWACFLWFSGLFSKHRSRIDVILEPLQSYLRYGRNGPCFI